MQILILGKSYPSKKLAFHLAKNKNNNVFTSFDMEGAINAGINISNEEDVAEFVKANEIKLVIVADRDLICIDWQEILQDSECRLFCPDFDAKKLCQSISSGKKFAYKNKIQTSKFAVFDKLPAIFEYISTSSFPVVIMPDIPNDTESAYIAETKSRARKQAERLFATGNKKLLIEDYVSPFEYTKYLISDNTGVMGLFTTVSYFDETSTNNIDNISEEIIKKIETELIPAVLDGLVEENIYYKGILGVCFKSDNKGNIYFSRFKPFFDELEIDIALNVIDEEIEDLFYFCAKDDLLNEYETINMNDNYVITENINGEIISASAKTYNKAIDRLIIEGGDIKTLDEAKKLRGLK